MNNDAMCDHRQWLLSLLFSSMADLLAGYDWKRQRIWKSKIASFEFQHSPGCRLSFDVFIGSDGEVKLHVVARDESHGESLARVLSDLREDVKVASGKGARFEVPLQVDLVDLGDLEAAAESAAVVIRTIRGLLAQWSGPPEEWIASTGVPIRFVDRPGRSQSDRLVVVFSSIRTKRYWLDFGGPHGDALKGVRARILFVLDDLGDDYNYHLLVSGSSSIEDATIEFLYSYISDKGLKPEDVVLCGMSKGATAAICLGSRMPNVLVLASVPQMQLGSYLAQREDGIFASMFGNEVSGESVSAADALVPMRLRAFLENGQNATILTSLADGNCSEVLADESGGWRDYENLDLVMFENPAVTDHASTLRYATPAFLGWLTLFGIGATPAGLGVALHEA